ncbi:MAG TPA: hypothetical protein VFT42_00520 [Solirubrobacteraceae bacterium]|nr:hypothetical protein [Solirubrobacteraceae bacterium]
MRASMPIAAAALAALLAGCSATPNSGSSATKFKGAGQQAAQTIEDLQTDGQNRDQAKICKDLLANALKARLGGNCQKVVEAAIKDTDSFDLTVTDVTVNGPSATATVRAKRGKASAEVDKVGLVREGGRWKISSLS